MFLHAILSMVKLTGPRVQLTKWFFHYECVIFKIIKSKTTTHRTSDYKQKAERVRFYKTQIEHLLSNICFYGTVSSKCQMPELRSTHLVRLLAQSRMVLRCKYRLQTNKSEYIDVNRQLFIKPWPVSGRYWIRLLNNGDRTLRLNPNSKHPDRWHTNTKWKSCV